MLMFVFGVISMLLKDDMMSWGWCVLFFVSVVLLVVGFVICVSVFELFEFEEVRKSGNIVWNLVCEVFKYWLLLLFVIGVNVYGIVGVYFSNIFMISYVM